MVELLPPQRLGVDKHLRILKEGNIAGNWSKTGTGKTLMGLALSKEIGLQPLVVAPLIAHATWYRWAEEFGVTPLDVVNVERLRTGKTPWVDIKTVGKDPVFHWNLDPNNTMVFWDELHKGLLGEKTVSGRCAAMLRPQGIKTVLASATPFNSPLNARALGYLFKLHNWSPASFYSWCRAHGCRPSPFHRGLVFDVESKLAPVHLGRINNAIRDRCVALTTDDLGDYFPKGNIVEPLLIKLSERDEKEAQRIYAEMAEEVRRKGHSNPLVDNLRARQRCELLKVPAMAELVADSLEEGLSVFVSLCFCDSVEKLQAALGILGVEDVVTVYGRQKDESRNAAINLFNTDFARVLIASPAGGESISLHQVDETQRNRTSMISPGYSASQLVQALGRIKRTLMRSPVVQRIVLCAGTVEERVARRVEAKSHAIDTLTDADLE